MLASIAPMEAIIIAAVFVINGAWFAAFISAAMHDRRHWDTIGRDKFSWMLAMMALSLFATLPYLLIVRPRLRRAALAVD